MATAKIDDAGFIALWEKHGGNAARIAKLLDVAERNVRARRRRIETRHRIHLGCVNREAPAANPEHFPARQQVAVKDGVVIVFSDAHFWPGRESAAYRGLLQLCAELRPRAIICNGDAFDGASISRHPRLGYTYRPTVVEELQAVAEYLSKIQHAAKGARRYWTLGNHDWRFESRLAATAPEFEGLQDRGFSLKSYFPDWVPCWSVWLNESVIVKHRYKGGIHATHNNTLWAGRTIVTGHLHSLKVTPFTDYDHTRFGVDTGTLADPFGEQFEQYMEDNPRNWRSGFVVLTFQGGRLTWPEVVEAQGDEIWFRGQIIKV